MNMIESWELPQWVPTNQRGLEKGHDPETEDTHDMVAHHRENDDRTNEGEVDQCDVTPGVGEEDLVVHH